MSDDSKKVKSITIEAHETGFAVCKGPLEAGVINKWYAFSNVEAALAFIKLYIDGKDSM